MTNSLAPGRLYVRKGSQRGRSGTCAGDRSQVAKLLGSEYL